MKLSATAVALILLLVASCASPREKALRSALKDYNRANRAAVEFARVQVNQLVAVTHSFQAAAGRWPQTYAELAQFALQNTPDFDPLVFSDVTFADLPDGSLQIHYDVNCSRFDTDQYKFTQSGSVNVRGR
jgi:hypothetical protein